MYMANRLPKVYKKYCICSKEPYKLRVCRWHAVFTIVASPVYRSVLANRLLQYEVYAVIDNKSAKKYDLQAEA